MEIIRMNKSDCRELAELDKICFSVPWSEKSFSDETENPVARYYVAKSEGEILGYGGIWLAFDEGQITNIAVLPKARKQGIASAILEMLISEAEGKSIVLEVRESNDAAISLYEKHGFAAVGMRKNFYRNPAENAVIMIRGEN